MNEVTRTIDARGQKCPMPVLLVAKAAKEMVSGETVILEATDGGARSDIPAWASQTGNEIISTSEFDGVLSFTIRKK
jgi:tRNA 2-thiouridine synthesizing protein A